MTDAPTAVEEPTEAPEEAAQEPQEAEQRPEQPEAPQEQPEAAEQAPSEPEQPADVVDVKGRDVAIASPAGSLTLRPNQKALDPEQRAALAAIGIDVASDPGVVPHLRAFVHMCQIKALDPWAREAYLIGRGQGQNRKYTMQTGIDGYRKMAKATGRFIRVKRTLWTGSDDDDRSFRMVEEDGDYVMKRVWYDQWPAERGHPGAAKAVIEHYDDYGNVTTTSAVADWSMYAAYKDVWEDKPNGGRRPKRDSEGKPVRELNEMWTKGGAHMLAKCAEALAHRKAFPAAMSGIYITEEMHRLDQQERDRQAEDKARQRREAFERSQQPSRPVAQADDVVDGEVVEEPQQAGEVAAEVVEEVAGNAEEATRLLMAELAWQADVLGQTAAALANRWVRKHRKNLDEFTAEELLPLVTGLRPMVVSAARSAGLPEAEAYAAVALDNPGTVDVEALDPSDETGDPDEEHRYVETDTGECFVCGLREDVGPHLDDEADGSGQ